MKQQAERRIMSILATSHFQGIPHKIILEHGDVMDVLSRLVEAEGIDLIVTGTHGKHGLQRLLSGSIAEEIFRLASIPVLAVGPEVVIDPHAELRIERILYACDFSPDSSRAMRYAYAVAREYGAHLFFLHVVEDAWREPFTTRVSADTFCRVQVHEKSFSNIEEGVQPEFLVEFGSAEELTLEVARKTRSSAHGSQCYRNHPSSSLGASSGAHRLQRCQSCTLPCVWGTGEIEIAKDEA
jgi:nucleotide-binding universal stress UspA family protein